MQEKISVWKAIAIAKKKFGAKCRVARPTRLSHTSLWQVVLSNVSCCPPDQIPRKIVYYINPKTGAVVFEHSLFRYAVAGKEKQENTEFDVAAEIKKHARVFKNGNISLQNQRVKVLYRNTSRWHNVKARWTSHVAVVMRGGEWIVEGRAANDALMCFLALNKQLEYLESHGLKRPSKILTCRIV